MDDNAFFHLIAHIILCGNPLEPSLRFIVRVHYASSMEIKSGHPESNQGPSDLCNNLQSDALPTEL